MGVQGFAAGLRNGFDMMDRYQSRQNQKKYQDDLLGLRHGYLDMQQSNADRNYQLAVDQNKVQNDRNDRLLKLQEQNYRGQDESRRLQNQLAQMGIDAQKERQKQDDWNNKWGVPVTLAYQAAASNGDYSQLDALRNDGAFDGDVGRHYDPMGLVSQEYAQKSADVATSLQKLANSQLPVDSPEFVAATHDPKLLENINFMLQGELDNHVGKTDLTGKEIRNQKISQIMVDPKTRQIVLGYDTEYTDGSKGHDTKYGEDGHPKPYKWTDLAGPLIQRAVLAHQLVNSPQALAQAAHLFPGADLKAMNQALMAADKAHMTALSKAADPESAARVDQSYADSVKNIRDMYGAGDSGKHGSIRDWIGSGKDKNRDKLAFINQQKQEVVERLAALYRQDPDAALAALNNGFGIWRKGRESNKGGNRSSAVPPRPDSRNASPSTQRNAGNNHPSKHDYRAAEHAALKQLLNVAPAPKLNNNPGGQGLQDAYKAMANQNR